MGSSECGCCYSGGLVCAIGGMVMKCEEWGVIVNVGSGTVYMCVC